MDTSTPSPSWPAGATHQVRSSLTSAMACGPLARSSWHISGKVGSQQHQKPRTSVREVEWLASSPIVLWTLRYNVGQAISIGPDQSPTTTNGREPLAGMCKGKAVRAVCPRMGARMLELSWFWCPGVRRNAQPSDNHDVGQLRQVPR